MKFTKGCRSFPIFDTVNLDGVHGDVIFANDDTKIFDFRDFELAFLGFEVQIVVGEDAQYIIDDVAV